jgi:FkbM family methyltransferase
MGSSRLIVDADRAALQWAALRAYGKLSARFGHRGMQRFSWVLGRFFHGVATVDLGGPRLRVRLADGYWTKMLIGDSYEPMVYELLERELGPDVSLVDCGANIGYWSVLASSRWGAPVVAVEASSESYKQLLENNRLNGDRFTAVRAAIWSRDGETLRLVTHDRRHAGSSVVNRRERIGERGYNVEHVETVTVDGLVDRYVARPKIVLKLDVEGAESEALKGAEHTLSELDTTLVYEDTDGAVTQLVQALGYRSRRVDDHNYVARRA